MRCCGCCVLELVKNCYICKKHITIYTPEVKCVSCKISMHNICYTEFSERKKNFDCPACKTDGTIGIDINNEDISEIEL
jgi:hypothetical protein